MSLEQSQAVLQGLLSDNNTVRGNAERQVEQLKADPKSFVVMCFQVLRAPTSNPGVAQMAASLISRNLVKTNSCMWEALDPQMKDYVKRELLAALQGMGTGPTTNMIAGVASDLAEYLYADNRGGWPELLQTVFEMTSSAEPVQRRVALSTFNELAIGLGGEIFRPYFGVIHGILQKGLTDTSAYEVRLAALGATAGFLQVMETNDSKQDVDAMKGYRDLLPAMLQCIADALQREDIKEALLAIDNFIAIAEAQCVFFQPHLKMVAQAMFQIMATPSLDEDIRSIALELLVTFCEMRPGAMKKLPDFVPVLIQALLQWIVNVDESYKWEAFEEPSGDTLSDKAEGALDRICMALHGQTIVPVLYSAINVLMNSQDWHQRYAAAQAILLSTEGCEKVLKKNMKETLANAVALSRDAHPRVRYAALNCIGQLCSDFAPSIEKEYGKEIVDALVAGMADSCPRVQAIATICIVNFTQDAPDAVIIRETPRLAKALSSLFTSPVVQVQENLISATTCLVEATSTEFAPFYDLFLPHLRGIVTNAKVKEYRSVRGKAIECIAFIGAAVEKERFTPDAILILKEMFQTTITPDDPQGSFFESAFGSLCSTLGEDFVQFIPQVVPLSIARAEVDPQIEVINDKDSLKEGWEIISEGEKSVCIHTSAIEDKASAIHMLAVYSNFHPIPFLQYVPKALAIAKSGIGYLFSENVRSSSYELLVQLMENITKAVEQGKLSSDVLASSWMDVFPAIIASLGHEDDPETLINATQKLSELFTKLGNKLCATPELMTKFTEILASLLKEWIATQAKSFAHDDEDVLDEENNDDKTDIATLISLILDCLDGLVQSLLSAYGNTFFPLFEQMISPIAVECIKNQTCKPVFLRGLSLLTSAFQFSSDAAAKYDSSLYPNMCGLLRAHADCDFVQMSSFFLGCCPKSLGAAFAPRAKEALELLGAVSSFVATQNQEEWVMAADNIASAAIKIAYFCLPIPSVPTSEVIKMIVGLLPIKEDDEEAKASHPMFLELCSKFPTDALGPGNSFAPQIFKAFAYIVNYGLFDLDKAASIASILKSMLQVAPNALSGLAADESSALQTFLTKF